MKKTLIIIRREYLTRIRKTSFIVMSLLGPALFTAMFLLPAWFATIEDEDVKHIAVFDNSWLFVETIPATSKFKFTYVVPESDDSPRNFVEDFKQNLWQTDFFGFMYVPDYIAYVHQGIEFYSYRQPPANLIMHIANSIEKEIETEKLKAFNIENLDNILHSVKTRIDIRAFILLEDGTIRERRSGLSESIASISAILTFLFIILFGVQIMQGVIEEKTNRIVEIIVSSVKPFQLMMGKVVGVALVGLTQFLTWVALTIMLIIPAKSIFLSGITDEVLNHQQTSKIQVIGSAAGDHIQFSETTEKALEILNILHSINFSVIIACFLFFFIGGFLLYGSLYAAIGSAVDSETDTHQFMLPVTIPLFIVFMAMINIIQNPDGQLAFWFSIIPFTSPIAMMARIPFGVHYVEIIFSVALLILAIVCIIWLSAKIYRTGILLYGKKITYRELWKLMRH